ncbi:MAG: universal stress protein [Paraglaciecola sp.]|uniref:universal stress protein n=1 Tax=Paraglaciecola sp. TaxID=1920173 RepID=UPI00273FB09A|nr:universal stress protein [Paraglaciecola sp.]MDP5031456.1 universal stress protein [Paraglaciecola sp.]MDP5130801.1 universal stress protein [Paraglaciecola sp.]
MPMCQHAFVIIDDNHHDLAVLRRTVACLGNTLQTIKVYRHTAQCHPKNTELWLQWQRSQIAEFTHLLAEFNLDIEVSYLFTHQHFHPEEFEQTIKQHQIDLVLKLSSGMHFFDGVFGSRLDHYFIADCSVPVWIVKSRVWDTDIEVLACLDVDDRSEINHKLNVDILKLSECMAHHLKGQLHVIDCFWGEVASMSFELDKSGRFKRTASILTHHQALLEGYVEQYALAQQSLHIVEGTPDFAIPDTAAHLNAELVVIGNNADHGILDRLFGDTAANLVNTIDCDVLVVKP